MDASTIQQFVQHIVTWLSPFFPYLIKGVEVTGTKWLESIGSKGGEKAIEEAVQAWNAIKQKSQNDKRIEGSALLLSEQPDNPEFQRLMANALMDVISKNPELIEELKLFKQDIPRINQDNRSGGVYFYGNTQIKGDVIGGDQTKN
ncbi:hypothetical protein [Chloroflexus aurantiacus]